MGCVLGREVSSGLVHNGREEKREGVNYEKKSKSISTAESTETLEVKGAENVTVDNEAVEANEGDVTKKEDKAEHDEKPRKERRRSKPDPRLSNPPKHKHGEQVAAGWPSWLSAHVGEAIDGWLPRRADTFEKIDKVAFRLVFVYIHFYSPELHFCLLMLTVYVSFFLFSIDWSRDIQ